MKRMISAASCLLGCIQRDGRCIRQGDHNQDHDHWRWTLTATLTTLLTPNNSARPVRAEPLSAGFAELGPAEGVVRSDAIRGDPNMTARVSSRATSFNLVAEWKRDSRRRGGRHRGTEDCRNDPRGAPVC